MEVNGIDQRRYQPPRNIKVIYYLRGRKNSLQTSRQQKWHLASREILMFI